MLWIMCEYPKWCGNCCVMYVDYVINWHCIHLGFYRWCLWMMWVHPQNYRWWLWMMWVVFNVSSLTSQNMDEWVGTTNIGGPGTVTSRSSLPPSSSIGSENILNMYLSPG
jgi:hypothetical protein